MQNQNDINDFGGDVDKYKNLTEAMKLAHSDASTRLRAQFDQAARERQALEQRWLDDLRQFKGVYSETLKKLIPKNKSRAFVRLTRRKVKTFTGRMMDLLFPASKDQNWDIKASDKLDESFKRSPMGLNAIQELATQMQEAGQAGDLDKDLIDQALKEAADEACTKMRTTIKDQLSEVNYREVCRAVIHSGNLYGTGVLKAPMVLKKEDRVWQVAENGSWSMVNTERVLPFLEDVAIWDYYPDLQAKTLDDCQYHYQRHRMNKRQLQDLARNPGFESAAEVIRDYLLNFPEGDADTNSYQSELDALSMDQATANKAPDKLYDVLECWSMVSGQDLMDMGAVPEGEEWNDAQITSIYWANVWLLGEFVIKAEIEPLPGINHPYHLYYFDKDESCLMGEGLASIMRDDQRAINAIRRASMDNVAGTVGNVYDVNVDLLLPDENPRDIYPDRVFLRGGDSMAPAVRAIATPSQLQHYLALNQVVEQSLHETTIPSYMHGVGDNGAGDTASGLSMLMGAANMDVKEQVQFFDDGITLPVIRSIYHWNMTFNEDPEIKGDFNIVARGSSSLVAKEIRAGYLDQAGGLLQSEQFAPFVKFHKLAQEIVNARDLGDAGIIMTEEEYEAQAGKDAVIEKLSAELERLATLVQLIKSMDSAPVKAAEAQANQIIAEKNGQMAKQNLANQVEMGAL